MTESTLSSQFTDLQKAVAHHLGLGIDSAKWSADQTAIIAMIIKRGLRQFYHPPRIYPDEPSHQWSFLKPTVTLTTVGTYSTGTVEVSSGTCTLTDGVWPSWAATHGTLTIGTTEYAITTRDGDTELTVVGDDVAAETTYSLTHSGNYDLPEDFGGIEGNMTYEPSEHKEDILIVGEGKIRNLRGGQTARSCPIYAAVRPKECAGTSVGQRFEIMFFPIPNDAYDLSYKKIILASALTGTIKYPYGGAMHAETLEASCIAMAELQEDEKKGPMYDYFIERLTASIQIDKTAYSAEFLGYNRDNSDAVHRDGGRNDRHRGNFLVTYNGEI